MEFRVCKKRVNRLRWRRPPSTLSTSRLPCLALQRMSDNDENARRVKSITLVSFQRKSGCEALHQTTSFTDPAITCPTHIKAFLAPTLIV